MNFDAHSSEMLASRLLRHDKPPLASNFMTLNPAPSTGHGTMGTLTVDREPQVLTRKQQLQAMLLENQRKLMLLQ